jgi:hypothetical protein
LKAAYSRNNELQADSLGIAIAGHACYNLQKGFNVFRRLHELVSQISYFRFSAIFALCEKKRPSEIVFHVAFFPLLKISLQESGGANSLLSTHPLSQDRLEHVILFEPEITADNISRCIKATSWFRHIFGFSFPYKFTAPEAEDEHAHTTSSEPKMSLLHQERSHGL